MATLFWPFDTSRVSEWCGGYSDVRTGIHMGTDFGVPQGTELRATTSGVIRMYSGNGGNGVDIVTDDGLVVRNWHLSEFRVNAGDRVEAGQVIGLTGGARGTWGAGNSTGPHLHWEIRDNIRFNDVGWIDPRDLTVYNFGDNVASTPAAPAAPTVGAYGEGIRGQGSDWTFWVPGTADQQTVQSRLAERGFYNGAIDGNLASDASVRALKLACGELGYFDLNYFDGEINKNLCYGILLLAQNHGGYSGFNNLFTDGYVWAAFDGGVASAIAIPAPPAPTPAPEPVAEVKPDPAPVVEKKPSVKPESAEHKTPSTPTKDEPVAEKSESVIILPPVDAAKWQEIENANRAGDDATEASSYDLTSVSFWNYAGERVIKTFAMTFSALLTMSGALVVSNPATADIIGQIGWGYIAGVAGLSALNSLLVALSSFKNIVTISKK